MRTANNNSNFTVEALVAKYRNYVNDNCPKTTLEYAPTGEIVEVSNPHYYMESLLLSLYTSAAGDKVNKNVVNALAGYSHLYQDYFKDALTNEEYEFLLNNFALFMDNLISVYPFSEVLSQPSRISLIKKYLLPQKGGKKGEIFLLQILDLMCPASFLIAPVRDIMVLKTILRVGLLAKSSYMQKVFNQRWTLVCSMRGLVIERYYLRKTVWIISSMVLMKISHIMIYYLCMRL